MRMKFPLLCMLIIAITVLLLPTKTEATSTPQRSIGLHDRMLPFQAGEVRTVNTQMVVPLEKMARYLNADIIKTANQMTVTKNNTSISYNYKTNETVVNGEIETVSTVQLIDGIPYIPLRFLGEATGFKVDYLSNILTARIYTDTYPHLSHPEFIKKVKTDRQPKPSSKPTTSPPASSDKPIVYLTFDDGPNHSTTENLRILKEYKVKGTFFFVGSQINYNQALTNQAHDEGHYIGLHSMTHDRSKLYASSKAFMGEMQKEADLIKKVTGHTSVLIRAPYGSSPYVTPAMREALKSKGYKLWDWDVDTVDWSISEANYQRIVNNVKNGVEKARRANDKHIVVLLHDRAQTNKALPAIIEWLQKSGYSIERYNPEYHVTQNFGNHKGI